MTTISAKSILASRHTQSGDTVHTLLLRYPRCIHAEMLTHRVFSRNSASSRAIPVEKLIRDVMENPFVPVVWGKNQKGMQADLECDERIKFRHDSVTREVAWLRARDTAVQAARQFANAGYHKQIVNRLLEPFAHITVVVTATNWSNFLALRDHKDAEPHIQILAREVRKALEGAEIRSLGPGTWHMPFLTKEEEDHIDHDDKLKLSVARCASTSYKTVDGFDMTLERAIELHDKLVAAAPLHASPAEHVCKADYGRKTGGSRKGDRAFWEWEFAFEHGNFTGFRQYRKMLPSEFL